MERGVGGQVDRAGPGRTHHEVDDLAALYDAEVDRVYGCVVNRVGRDAAADIVSEVFYAGALAVRTTDGAPLSAAWLMAMARNKVNDH